jgi:hypothetical protein
MRLTLHSFKSDVPREKVCQPGVEYEVFESEVGPDEALAFFARLIYPRDSFSLEVPRYALDFWKHDGAIWVEVTGADFWATSGVSRDEAKAIIEALDHGEGFGSRIPAAGREWDACSILRGGGPAGHGAI